MDLPRGMKWVGPLFLILYIALWLSRGLVPFAIMLVYAFAIPLFLPLIIFVFILLFMVLQDRHAETTLVAYLCFFVSGILIEPVPTPIGGIPLPNPPLPPPDIMSAPIMFLTSLVGLLVLLIHSSYVTPVIVVAIIVEILSIITVLVTSSFANGQLGCVQTMILLVMILLFFTFSYIPLIPWFGHVHYMPVPLGPLSALILLPRISEKNTQ
ncbi:MAG: hypothetical protein ACFFES_07990 [Candidatus Thorarchaeota archaeon]